MITTSCFPNKITAINEGELAYKPSSISKEDLEGKVKTKILTISNKNKNGGSCQNIKL